MPNDPAFLATYDPDELLTVRRLGQVLSVDRATAYSLAHAIGVVRLSIGDGRRIRVRRRDLSRWLDERTDA